MASVIYTAVASTLPSLLCLYHTGIGTFPLRRRRKVKISPVIIYNHRSKSGRKNKQKQTKTKQDNLQLQIRITQQLPTPTNQPTNQSFTGNINNKGRIPAHTHRLRRRPGKWKIRVFLSFFLLLPTTINVVGL